MTVSGRLCGWILGALALVSTCRAAEIVVDRVGATSQGFLFVDYSLDSPFQGKSLEAIRSGLPTTITYSIEVWRQRGGWWDRLEETRETQVRVLRDLLSDEYVLVSREEVRRFRDLATLTETACRNRREYLRPLASNKSYYAIVTVNLAPLSVADLQELEEWMQGTLRGGESRPGGVAGISGTLVGLMLSATGFGDETIRGRSPTFVPESVPRATEAPARAPATPEPGRRAPESGRAPASKNAPS